MLVTEFVTLSFYKNLKVIQICRHVTIHSWITTYKRSHTAISSQNDPTNSVKALKKDRS